MKICSWNMFLGNAEQERAFAFIRDGEWDVFCLQEVTEELLAKLRTLPDEIAVAPEVDRRYRGKHATQYLVILARHSIQNVDVFPLPYREPELPLRGKLFAKTMFSSGLWAEGIGNRHAMYADIELPNGLVRVANLHLPLLNPRWRAEELELAMRATGTSLPLVVCGDFNIVESPRVSILNWLLGGTIADTFFWNRERRAIEKYFAEIGLSNPLRGQSTHPLSRSQLDHILISNPFLIEKTDISLDRFGSDHAPVALFIQKTA